MHPSHLPATTPDSKTVGPAAVDHVVVTAQQMAAIEARIFDAGMPVAGLMEKVAGRIAQRVAELHPLSCGRVGVLAGPGHNGGDALVVARELHLRGYKVKVFQPFSRVKELTQQHAQYVTSLGIDRVTDVTALADCAVLIDGLFGFGLERSLTGEIAALVDRVNQWSIPVISIDLPSGVHTDSGAVLGTAIRATHTLCLGLWKRACLQEDALDYLGHVELLEFDIPWADIEAVLGQPGLQRMTRSKAMATLLPPRSLTTHKYKQGHVLLVCGSGQYPGAAMLSALAAQASGVGMLTIAVPHSLKLWLVGQLPGAIVIGCEEQDQGAIAHLPNDLDWSRFQAIACGPGLTTRASSVVQQVLETSVPLVLDADGLNCLATLGVHTLRSRSTPTVLTPHLGEFRRLFPDLAQPDRIELVRLAAQHSASTVVLKGARTLIANDQGQVWMNPDSTSALARGGSGDVLTGLMGGLLAQGMMHQASVSTMAAAAVWWHSHAAQLAARDRTELGVDPSTLAHTLIPALQWNRA
ncbi:NAD(P)H-hydrate dehydratase [Leptolyngbya sp. AN02str]|uniref:NAD(P)H-hydrate dehydratase n=1 Tax=Leptolyngbya sp. AN02str TaxID=3423363 RepID=UPI003D3159F6